MKAVKIISTAFLLMINGLALADTTAHKAITVHSIALVPEAIELRRGGGGEGGGLGLILGGDFMPQFRANLIMRDENMQELARFPVLVRVWSVGLTSIKLEFHDIIEWQLNRYAGHRVSDLLGRYFGGKLEAGLVLGASYSRYRNRHGVAVRPVLGIDTEIGVACFGGYSQASIIRREPSPVFQDKWQKQQAAGLSWDSQVLYN